jgi:hypothetical protein
MKIKYKHLPNITNKNVLVTTGAIMDFMTKQDTRMGFIYRHAKITRFRDSGMTFTIKKQPKKHYLLKSCEREHKRLRSPKLYYTLARIRFRNTHHFKKSRLKSFDQKMKRQQNFKNFLLSITNQ